MSGLAAVFIPDGRPADPAVLSVMLDAMRVRGPDGTSAWHRGPAALGFLALHTTPESQHERQPYEDPRTGRVVVFDGRLDNRDDLIAALAGAASPRDGDAALALAAFERWGTDAPVHLLGDFAFTLWDPAARRILCARDVMGVRPLCYAQTNDGALLIASEMRALLATGLVDASINEGRALEFLSERGYHGTETLYTAITRLAPAHTLIAGPSGIRTHRHWDFDAGASIRHRRDEDYVEHARHLLTQAVRAQTRAVGRVGISLSGGVDSSALTALTSAAGVECEGFSVVFPGRPCDETPFIDAVSAHCGVPATKVPYQPARPGWYAQNTSDYQDLAEYPNGVMLDGAHARASASGVRVLLTGCGGDEWFAGSRFHYADWLRQGAAARIVRQLTADVAVRGPRRAMLNLAMFGVWPVLPGAVRSGIKHVVRSKSREVVPAWIHPDTASRTGLASRIAFKVSPREGETFAQAEMRLLMTIGIQAHNEEMDDRSMTRAAVEHRHPFYDRRIMEFAYALPEDQRWRGRYRKHLLRSAVPELPEAIRWRQDNAEFTGVMIDGLRSVMRPSVPRLSERGWIVPEVFLEMHGRCRRALASGDACRWPLVMPLWMMFAVECWLEQTMTRSHHDRRTETAAIA